MHLSIKLFLLCNQGYFKPKGSTNCEKKITCLRSKLAEYKSTKVSEFFANVTIGFLVIFSYRVLSCLRFKIQYST